MPCNFSKQPQFLPRKYFNSGNGDAVLQGQLTGVPTGVVASQGNQDLPGDRIIFGAADALALSDPAVGTLYNGLYQYVQTSEDATLDALRCHAAFWDPSVPDSQYQVTPDESGKDLASDPAGVYIIDQTAGYWWWIQIAGKVEVQWRAALTGTPVAGCGAYIAVDGLGDFDVLYDAGVTPTMDVVDQMFVHYMGLAYDVIPSNNNTSLIDVPIWRVRW